MRLCRRPALLRSRARLAVLALLLVPSSAIAAFDPAYESKNFSKIDERFRYVESDPAFQADLRAKGAQREAEGLQILATDGPGAEDGRDFTGNLCWQHMDGCEGDPRYYDWAKSGFGIVKPILFGARNGSTLSGHLFYTAAGPSKRPGVVITNGSVQAPEELYWHIATNLAKAGYVVMTWDPQGQGYSDTYGEGADRQDGVPSQSGEPFFDGTEDALDFFFSTPAAPYSPRKSCTSGTDHSAKHRRRVASGRNSAYNAAWALLDPSRVGIAGHSFGAAAVSYIGQLDPRVRAIVAWDNLSAPAPAISKCKRPATAPVRVPALGMSADYGLTPNPNTSEPDPTSKSTGSVTMTRRAVDTGELIVRGGTHYEFSFIPNPAFGGTLRGEDMATWYTNAWFDKYVAGDPTADARLLTDRWRRDSAEGAVDPDADANLFSGYYRSRIDIGLADGGRYLCEDLRTLKGCASLRSDDGRPAAFSALASASTKDSAAGPGLNAAGPTSPGGLSGSTGNEPATAGASAGSASRPACRDTVRPTSAIARSSRISRKGLRLAGTARDRGCGARLARVEVAVARAVGHRCAFLRTGGVTGPPRDCRRSQYMPAAGGATWRLRLPVHLRPGAFKVWSRAIDTAGNVETKRRSGNFRRMRAR